MYGGNTVLIFDDKQGKIQSPIVKSRFHQLTLERPLVGGPLFLFLVCFNFTNRASQSAQIGEVSLHAVYYRFQDLL